MSLVEEREIDYAFFDVCGTLYQSNTTHDFFLYLLNNQPSFIKRYKFLLFYSMPAKIIWKIFNLVGLSFIPRRISLGLIKGFSEKFLRGIALNFYTNYLGKRRIDEVHNLMEYLRLKGTKVVLVSASINLMIETIANENNIKLYHSTTLFKNSDNKYSGKFIDIEKAKLSVVLNNYPDIKWDNCLFVSDNTEDEPLLKAVGIPVVVANNKLKKFWRSRHISNLFIIDK